MKTAVVEIATKLNPAGSNPNFGVFFYGASSIVHQVVSLGTTNSASIVESKLDLKQYTPTQSQPSTLTSAMNAVLSSCISHCRAPSRVIVVLTTSPDIAAAAVIRRIEHGALMTVIMVGIGLNSHTNELDLLATYPSRYYGIKLSSFTELLVSTSYIASLVSSVPPFNIGRGTAVNFGNTLPGTYYTVQFFPNHFYTLTNDSIVLFTWNCPACSLYISLSEPNPSQTNTISLGYANLTYPSGYAMSHFRLPKHTQRFFLSLMGTGQNVVTGAFQVFSTTTMTEALVIGNDLSADLSITIG